MALTSSNIDVNRANLHCQNAQYIRYLEHKHFILQKKTNFHWLKEGEANSKKISGCDEGKKKENDYA